MLYKCEFTPGLSVVTCLLMRYNQKGIFSEAFSFFLPPSFFFFLENAQRACKTIFQIVIFLFFLVTFSGVLLSHFPIRGISWKECFSPIQYIHSIPSGTFVCLRLRRCRWLRGMRLPLRNSQLGATRPPN